MKKSEARIGNESRVVAAGWLPTSFHDVTALMEVDLATWRAVVDRAGERQRATACNAYDSLWTSLTTTAPGAELMDALEVIHELGNDTGRELLAQAAIDQQVALDVEHRPPRELAAEVWIDSRTKDDFANVLVRARVKAREASATHARTYREFVGKTSRASLKIDKQALLDAVARWCREQKKSPAVGAFVYEREGEWRCEILRGDAVKRVVEIRKGRPGILNFQPAASDHLRYDAATGRLGIATRSPRLVAMYKDVFGLLLANDAEFFARDHVCSLKPLQDHGRALFERQRVPGILHVDVVDLRWRRGDRDRILVSSRDCFQVLGDIGARLNEGELVEAKLVITFAGGARRGRVTLKPPYEINIQAGANERLVERLLDVAGIRGAFGDERGDAVLWSHAPFRLTESRWRQLVGPDFDRLRREQILRPIQLEAAVHPDHPAAGLALTAQEADAAGTIVGISDTESVPLRTLTMSDLEGYELDVAAVVRKIREELGLDGVSTEIAPGLWAVGRRVLASGSAIAVFVATRQPPPAVAAPIRDAANGAQPILLVPDGCACDSVAVRIECPIPSGPYDVLLATIVERLGWKDLVPPHLWLHEELLVDATRGTAWFRGVQLTKLTADSHPFRFAAEVIRAAPRVVTKEQLNRVLSGARTDSDVAKKAKADFLRAVKASYEAAGRACPDVEQIFASRGGGYVLLASARVL